MHGFTILFFSAVSLPFSLPFFSSFFSSLSLPVFRPISTQSISYDISHHCHRFDAIADTGNCVPLITSSPNPLLHLKSLNFWSRLPSFACMYIFYLPSFQSYSPLLSLVFILYLPLFFVRSLYSISFFFFSFLFLLFHPFHFISLIILQLSRISFSKRHISSTSTTKRISERVEVVEEIDITGD